MHSCMRILLVNPLTGLRGWYCLVDEQSARQIRKASLALSYKTLLGLIFIGLYYVYLIHYLANYLRFHLQDIVNWCHQFFSLWDSCCCMSDFSNHFFVSFEWHPCCHAHNIVQIRINNNFPFPHQFDAPCCAINQPT